MKIKKFQHITGPGVIRKGVFHPSPIRKCYNDMLNLVVKIDRLFTRRELHRYFFHSRHITFNLPTNMTKHEWLQNSFYVIFGRKDNHFIVWPVSKPLCSLDMIRYNMFVHLFL